MRKNKMMRIASVLLVAVLLSTCAISGTFAKYTSKYTSETSSARVAKWAFTGSATSANFQFDLFDTVKDADGNTENDVRNNTSDGKNVIAPGTSGQFAINLTNASEVNAEYSVAFNVTNANVPLEFSVDGGTTWTSAPSVSATDINMGATATITVQWRWSFEGNDGDTNLGLAGNAEPSVSATVTITQKD